MKRWPLSAGFLEPVVLGALALWCLPNVLARVADGDAWILGELLAGTGVLAVVCFACAWLTYERPPHHPASPVNLLEPLHWYAPENHHIQSAFWHGD